MADIKENIGNIAEEFLKAKSYVKDKVFENFGIKDVVDKIVASNLTVAFFTHFKNGDSKEKCINDVNEVYTEFLRSLNKDSDKKIDVDGCGSTNVISS